MANDVTKLISYENLSSYDSLIKQYIGTEDAKSLHKVIFDSTNKVIKFYKNPDAVVTDTADFTIDIPADLDSTATIASVSNGVVTIKAGLTEADGIVSNNSDSDIVLAKAATTGAAEDISIADAGGLITADDVEGALQELASASAGGVASKTVYITETAGSSSDPFSKKYGIYQGSTGSSSSPVAGEKLADIDIPKDMVVEEGSVVDITYNSTDGKLYDGSTDVTEIIKGAGGTASASDAGKYIKLIVANATSDRIYIKATDLVDIYTTEQGASQIQLTIDSSNVISAVIVAGSVTATELASDAVTTAKILDENVTKAKLAQGVQDSLDLADSAVQSVTASDPTTGTNGTFVVDGTEVAIKGLGSAAYTASTAYEAAGSIATAIGNLDSSTATATATSGSSLDVLTAVGIEDGLISTKTYTTLGSAASHADTDYMHAADYSTATAQDISDLFS